MKGKIVPLIIGILIGAIITSAGFIIYMKTTKKGGRPDFKDFPQMDQSQDSDQNRGTPPDLPNGEKPSRNSNTNGEKPAENTDNEKSTNTQNNDQTQNT